MKVNFLPKNNVNARVCEHPFNSDFTFSIQTDARYYTSIYTAEYYSMLNNIRSGCFTNNLSTEDIADVKEMQDSGVIKHDIYFPTDLWVNPKTGVTEQLPDYYVTAWTQKGVDAFSEYGVVLGATKSNRYPKHGQNLYDLTSGVLGFNTPTQSFGTSDGQELKGIISQIDTWYNSQCNKLPSTISYRNGDVGMSQSAKGIYIGGRNSVPSPTNLQVKQNTQYGNDLGFPAVQTTRDLFISFPNSSRDYDAIYHENIPEETINERLDLGIKDTILNKGWYKIFMHYHQLLNAGRMDFLDQLMKRVNSYNIGKMHTSSKGDAIEYLFLRDITHRVIANNKNKKISVTIETKEVFNELPINRISQDLHVLIDLSNTDLAGNNLSSSYKKPIKIDINKWIVLIPFNGYGFDSVQVSEGANYIDTKLDLVVTNNDNTLVGNRPFKVVVFSTDKKTVLKRYNDFKLNHTIIENGIIGVIDEIGQMKII